MSDSSNSAPSYPLNDSLAYIADAFVNKTKQLEGTATKAVRFVANVLPPPITKADRERDKLKRKISKPRQRSVSADFYTQLGVSKPNAQETRPIIDPVIDIRKKSPQEHISSGVSKASKQPTPSINTGSMPKSRKVAEKELPKLPLEGNFWATSERTLAKGLRVCDATGGHKSFREGDLKLGNGVGELRVKIDNVVVRSDGEQYYVYPDLTSPEVNSDHDAEQILPGPNAERIIDVTKRDYPAPF